MSKELFTELKEKIIEEFQKMTAVLDNCELLTPKAFQKPLCIDSERLLESKDEEICLFLKENFSKLSKDIIYKIELIAISNKEELISCFDKTKKNKFDGRAYTRFNKENIASIYENESKNIALYIGSSQTKGIINRMRCHFGVGAKKTYAIHLKSWLPKSQKCKIKITLFEVSYPIKSNQTTNILELLEQELWLKEKPLLGKKSGLL